MSIIVLPVCAQTKDASTPSTSPTPIASASAQPHTATPIVLMQSKDMMDRLLAWIQILGLIGLIVYVFKTWQIASEMKAARAQEIAPHVIVYIDMPYGDGIVMEFVVKNIGKSVAKGIKFKFEPTLQRGFPNRVNDFDITIVREGIRSLAPGQEIRRFFDVATNYFGDKRILAMLEHPLPLVYKLTVSFNGGLEDKAFETEQTFDLSMFKDYWILADRRTEQDLIKATMDFAQSSNRVSHHLGAIEKSLGKAFLSPQSRDEKSYEDFRRSGVSGDSYDSHRKHSSTLVILFLLLGAAVGLLSSNAKSSRTEGGET